MDIHRHHCAALGILAVVVLSDAKTLVNSPIYSVSFLSKKIIVHNYTSRVYHTLLSNAKRFSVNSYRSVVPLCGCAARKSVVY